jgi:hypothetical protein
MATLPKVLINRADYQIGGGVALRLRTQDQKIERLLQFTANEIRAVAVGCLRPRPSRESSALIANNLLPETRGAAPVYRVRGPKGPACCRSRFSR